MIPGSPEWNRTMTASKVAAVLGVANPNWSSPFALWHQMRNNVPEQPQTKPQSRGHFLEPAILAWWHAQHPEFSRPIRHPSYTLGDWAAATPDAVAFKADIPTLVEAKTDAGDGEEWGSPGTDQIPAGYLCQCYWAMHLSGVPKTYVSVLTRYLEFREYVVVFDPEIGRLLEAKCWAFYQSTIAGDGEPPELDSSPATYEVLRAMHKDIQRAASVTLTHAQALEYVDAANASKAAETRARAAKSVVLDVMGDAQYAKCEGLTVARRQPAKGGAVALYQVAMTPEPFLPEGTTAA